MIMLVIVLINYGKRGNRETQVRRRIAKYCLRLQIGWSKLIRMLLVSLSNNDCVLAVSDEDKKIAWKKYSEKLLKIVYTE